MPKIGSLGALSSRGFGEFLGAYTPVYIEDVFSPYTYTGSGSDVTISNGIDLSTKGGMVWVKNRTNATGASAYSGSEGSNILFDTLRGMNLSAFSRGLRSNGTNAQTNFSTGGVGANTDGFTAGYNGFNDINLTSNIYASWTFRKQSKFFDLVTYTGDGSSVRSVSHSLGSVPGMIIVKSYSTTGDWAVYHRSIGNTGALLFNTTSGTITSNTYWNNTSPTASDFTVGSSANVNASGVSYVAYLFAHDAGGFGLTGSDNVISCGQFSTDGSGNATVTLGYEPQLVLIKNITSTGSKLSWYLIDNIRNLTTSSTAYLASNVSSAEGSVTGGFRPTNTGFTSNGTSLCEASSTYVYMAIRRGPMKTPTTATKVFSPIAFAGGTANRFLSYGFPLDLWVDVNRNGTSLASYEWAFFDRLLSVDNAYRTTANSIWGGGWGTTYLKIDSNTGATLPDTNFLNAASQNFVAYGFGRAPGFFDVCIYSGTGSAQNITHNLGAVPELMFVKCYNQPYDWWVYNAPRGNTKYLVGNSTASESSGATAWNNTTPTSSVFTVGTGDPVNRGGNTYSAYLFASCPKVSKVGSYTGTGSTQTISCGFTGGARFVMIKRTDAAYGWYLFDTARGMQSGTDPYSFWNVAGNEVNANNVYSTTGGFQLVSSDAGVNQNGGTYIYLAIA